jgi:tRNA nucleotidyltransferase (CCA-adding enzyme)
MVRFAVLVHDLGKGTTPKDILPSHHGHEERSVALLKELCGRLRVPKRFEQLAVAVARLHGRVHRVDRLRSAKVHDLLQECGALRDPGALDDLLLACEADARGRKGLEDEPYPQAALLTAALRAALEIKGDALGPTQLEGPAFGAALRQLRIEAIERMRVSQPP